MVKRNILVGGRLFFGLLTVAAIGIQLSIHVDKGFNVVNFFSYFTNLSNIFASVILIIGALLLIRGSKPTRTYDIVRGASVVAMVLVGITFVLLLRNEDLGALRPWINTLLHYIMPIVVLADWLYQPPRTKFGKREIILWTIPPLVYLTYSLIRGAIVKWYAYPFLNPDKANGYVGVALYCVAILAMFFGASWLLVGLSSKLNRKTR